MQLPSQGDGDDSEGNLLVSPGNRAMTPQLFPSTPKPRVRSAKRLSSEWASLQIRSISARFQCQRRAWRGTAGNDGGTGVYKKKADRLRPNQIEKRNRGVVRAAGRSERGTRRWNIGDDRCALPSSHVNFAEIVSVRRG